MHIPVENSNLLEIVFGPQMLYSNSYIIVHAETVYDIPGSAVMSWWSNNSIGISPLPRHHPIYGLHYPTYSQLCCLLRVLIKVGVQHHQVILLSFRPKIIHILDVLLWVH